MNFQESTDWMTAMHVTRTRIERLLVRIARTREEESTCDECAQLCAQLVQAILDGQVHEERFADILHHLEMCIPCGEEFVFLKDCACMDQENSWPSLEELWRQILSDRVK